MTDNPLEKNINKMGKLLFEIMVILINNTRKLPQKIINRMIQIANKSTGYFF